jgi:hypothetical protein
MHPLGKSRVIPDFEPDRLLSPLFSTYKHTLQHPFDKYCYSISQPVDKVITTRKELPRPKKGLAQLLWDTAYPGALVVTLTISL